MKCRSIIRSLCTRWLYSSSTHQSSSSCWNCHSVTLSNSMPLSSLLMTYSLELCWRISSLASWNSVFVYLWACPSAPCTYPPDLKTASSITSHALLLTSHIVQWVLMLSANAASSLRLPMTLRRKSPTQSHIYLHSKVQLYRVSRDHGGTCKGLPRSWYYILAVFLVPLLHLQCIWMPLLLPFRLCMSHNNLYLLPPSLKTIPFHLHHYYYNNSSILAHNLCCFHYQFQIKNRTPVSNYTSFPYLVNQLLEIFDPVMITLNVILLLSSTVII